MNHWRIWGSNALSMVGNSSQLVLNHLALLKVLTPSFLEFRDSRESCIYSTGDGVPAELRGP